MLLLPVSSWWDELPGEPAGGSAGRGDQSCHPATAIRPASPCHPSPRLARRTVLGGSPLLSSCPRWQTGPRERQRLREVLQAALAEARDDNSPTHSDCSYQPRPQNALLPNVGIRQSAL